MERGTRAVSKKGLHEGFLKGRSKFLLVSLFVLSMVNPLIKNFYKFELDFLDVILTVLLLSALYSLRDNKKLLITGVILVVPLFALSWTGITLAYPWGCGCHRSCLVHRGDAKQTATPNH